MAKKDKKVSVHYNALSNAIYLALTLLELDSNLFRLVMDGDEEKVKNYALSCPPEKLFLPQKGWFNRDVTTDRHIYHWDDCVDALRYCAKVMKEAESS